MAKKQRDKEYTRKLFGHQYNLHSLHSLLHDICKKNNNQAGKNGVTNHAAAEDTDITAQPNGEIAKALELKKRKTQEALRKDLEKRNLLEERIMSMVGGKTGLDLRWDEIVYWAGKGDVPKFLQFALNYPRKADLLQKEYDALQPLLSAERKEQYRKLEARGYEDARLLGSPYEYQDKCEELLANSRRLSAFLELPREGDQLPEISAEKLIQWYNSFMLR